MYKSNDELQQLDVRCARALGVCDTAQRDVVKVVKVDYVTDCVLALALLPMDDYLVHSQPPGRRSQSSR